MSNKRYAKIKSFIRENYKFLLFIVACQIFFLFPLPFVIDAPGGLLPVSDRVQVEDGTSSQGSFNLAYVKEIQANISTYLVSLINKDWDLIKQEEVKYDHETMKDAETRSKLLLKQGQQNATIVAYTHAKKQVDLQDPHFYVAYLDASVNSDIQIGDELLEFNHQKITVYEEIAQKVEQTKLGEEVTLTIQREQEEKESAAGCTHYAAYRIGGSPETLSFIGRYGNQFFQRLHGIDPEYAEVRSGVGEL